MENDCHIVSSRGLLKSSMTYTSIIKSSGNEDRSYLLEIKKNQIKGRSIYVCSDSLTYFVSQILPYIECDFFLVSGDSDLMVPNECLSDEDFNTLVESPFLIKWLAQNFISYHNKVIQMPIGIDYHTIANNPNHELIHNNEGGLPIDQEKILKHTASKAIPFFKRICKIFSNVHLRPDRHGDRHNAIQTIPITLITSQDGSRRTHCWETMIKYSFVLSPYGNGYDCHRTWEAIYLGCIPIVRAPHFKQLFEDLPVLNVKEWSDVTQELLENTILEFKTKTFNYDKLTLKYWTEQFKYSSINNITNKKTIKKMKTKGIVNIINSETENADYII